MPNDGAGSYDRVGYRPLPTGHNRTETPMPSRNKPLLPIWNITNPSYPSTRDNDSLQSLSSLDLWHTSNSQQSAKLSSQLQTSQNYTSRTNRNTGFAQDSHEPASSQVHQHSQRSNGSPPNYTFSNRTILSSK
nr:hypothetical protein L204_03633 [Cryptococcus depauperatus CBS 7855]